MNLKFQRLKLMHSVVNNFPDSLMLSKNITKCSDWFSDYGVMANKNKLTLFSTIE